MSTSRTFSSKTLQVTINIKFKEEIGFAFIQLEISQRIKNKMYVCGMGESGKQKGQGRESRSYCHGHSLATLAQMKATGEIKSSVCGKFASWYVKLRPLATRIRHNLTVIGVERPKNHCEKYNLFFYPSSIVKAWAFFTVL